MAGALATPVEAQVYSVDQGGRCVAGGYTIVWDTQYLQIGEAGTFWAKHPSGTVYEAHTVALDGTDGSVAQITIAGAFFNDSGFVRHGGSGPPRPTAQEALEDGQSCEGFTSPAIGAIIRGEPGGSAGEGGTVTVQQADLEFVVDEEVDADLLIDQAFDDLEDPDENPLTFTDVPYFAPITLKPVGDLHGLKPYTKFINMDATWWRDNAWSTTLGVVATGFASWYALIIIWRELQK